MRGLDPGRLPPAYLVVRLRVRVNYHNPGARPLIMPLERERTVYTSIRPGAAMKVFHTSLPIFESGPVVMKDLPADVAQDSPIDPKNDVFTIIPARGDMDPPLTEDIEIPVDRQTLLQRNPDLRGHRLFLRLKFHQRDLSPALYAAISDRWTHFGVPWTGLILTNTVAIDIPRKPEALPCTDEYFPAGAEGPVTGK